MGGPLSTFLDPSPQGNDPDLKALILVSPSSQALRVPWAYMLQRSCELACFKDVVSLLGKFV